MNQKNHEVSIQQPILILTVFFKKVKWKQKIDENKTNILKFEFNCIFFLKTVFVELEYLLYKISKDYKNPEEQKICHFGSGFYSTPIIIADISQYLVHKNHQTIFNNLITPNTAFTFSKKTGTYSTNWNALYLKGEWLRTPNCCCKTVRINKYLILRVGFCK